MLATCKKNLYILQLKDLTQHQTEALKAQRQEQQLRVLLLLIRSLRNLLWNARRKQLIRDGRYRCGSAAVWY